MDLKYTGEPGPDPVPADELCRRVGVSALHGSRITGDALCYKHILVDCHGCGRRGVPTGQPFYNDDCGVPGCSAFSIANLDEDVQYMEPYIVQRNSCPRCIQHGNMTTAADPQYQFVQDTRPARQEGGTYVIPQDMHFALNRHGQPASSILPELRDVSFSPPQGPVEEDYDDDPDGGQGAPK